MNSHKTTVIPFPASSKNGVRYSAETEKQNNVIGTRLSEELKNRKLSKKEFCTTLKDFGVDVSQSALGKWTNGLTVPNAYQLLAICYALDLEDGLAAFTGEHTPLLNEAGAEKVRAYREDLIATGKYNPMPVPAEADFGVRVSGNSMEPVYHDGQIVWVERCETLSIGQVGVFVYDGEGYLKSYGEREPDESDRDAFTDSYGRLHMQPVLISYNKEYSDRIISPERGFRVIGRVL